MPGTDHVRKVGGSGVGPIVATALVRIGDRLAGAESKSKWFAFIKAHSEKMRIFDINPFKMLPDISECRRANGD